MSDNIFKLGKAKFLKDNNNNIILPRTTTGLVTTSEGVTVDELFANRAKDLKDFSDRLETVERKLDNLDEDYDKFKTEQHVEIYNLSGRIGAIQGFVEYESSLPMKEVREIIDVNVELNSRLGQIEDDLARIDDIIAKLNEDTAKQEIDIASINERLTILTKEHTTVTDLLEEKSAEIKTEMNEIKDSIKELKDAIDMNMTPVSALMAVIELYEMFVGLHQEQLQPVSDYVIDIYYTLYRLEELSLGEMPEHIQDLIHARILKDELNSL